MMIFHFSHSNQTWPPILPWNLQMSWMSTLRQMQLSDLEEQRQRYDTAMSTIGSCLFFLIFSPAQVSLFWVPKTCRNTWIYLSTKSYRMWTVTYSRHRQDISHVSKRPHQSICVRSCLHFVLLDPLYFPFHPLLLSCVSGVKISKVVFHTMS